MLEEAQLFHTLQTNFNSVVELVAIVTAYCVCICLTEIAIIQLTCGSSDGSGHECREEDGFDQKHCPCSWSESSNESLLKLGLFLRAHAIYCI